MFRHAFKKVVCFALGVAALALWPGQVFADTQTVVAHVAFDTPISMAKVSDIDFGTVAAGTAATYTIDTSGAVTSVDGGTPVQGPTMAGNITVAGSTTQAVAITVDNYVAQNGVSLQNATCSYDGDAEMPCAISNAPAPGAGKTLLVGVDAVVDGTQIAGMAASPSFNITVVYQ